MSQQTSDRLYCIKPGKPAWVSIEFSDTFVVIRREETCNWVRNGTRTHSIPTKQIIGCQMLPKKINSGKSRFSLFGYAAKMADDNDTTEFKPLRFVFETKDDDSCKNWISRFMEVSRESRVGLEHCLDSSRKLVVFVNPKSGNGRAVKMFEKSLRPALECSNTPYELILTQRPNHGREFAATSDLSRWRGFVIVSGDGLLHEIIQGFFDRQDKSECSQIPLGILPAGSGNGLARSLAYINKEKYDKDEAFGSVLNIVSGRVQPMDLTRVRTQSGRTYHSFLSIGWGFLADCDIESERLRFVGEPRFTIWAAVRIANLRHYKGRITYKAAGSMSNDWSVIEDDFVSVYCVSLPWIGTSLFMAPNSKLADGVLYLVIIRKGVSRIQLINILTEFESGKHLEAPQVETLVVTAFKLEPLTDQGHITLDGELIEFGPIEAEVVPGCVNLMTK